MPFIEMRATVKSLMMIRHAAEVNPVRVKYSYSKYYNVSLQILDKMVLAAGRVVDDDDTCATVLMITWCF